MTVCSNLLLVSVAWADWICFGSEWVVLFTGTEKSTEGALVVVHI